MDYSHKIQDFARPSCTGTANVTLTIYHELNYENQILYSHAMAVSRVIQLLQSQTVCRAGGQTSTKLSWCLI